MGTRHFLHINLECSQIFSLSKDGSEDTLIGGCFGRISLCSSLPEVMFTSIIEISVSGQISPLFLAFYQTVNLVNLLDVSVASCFSQTYRITHVLVPCGLPFVSNHTLSDEMLSLVFHYLFHLSLQSYLDRELLLSYSWACIEEQKLLKSYL